MQPEARSLGDIRFPFSTVLTIFCHFILQHLPATHATWFSDPYHFLFTTAADTLSGFSAKNTSSGIEQIQNHCLFFFPALFQNSPIRSARLVYLSCSLLFLIISWNVVSLPIIVRHFLALVTAVYRSFLLYNKIGPGKRGRITAGYSLTWDLCTVIAYACYRAYTM